MTDALEPISLGYLCEVKYQLSRTLFLRRRPDGDLEDFRRQLMDPQAGVKTFRRHVFDWQITPFPAVLAYLEADFQGVFERQDLVIADGEVVHARLGTRHPHDFQPVDGVLDAAAVDAQYPAARSKFDFLATRFRNHLRTPGGFLYVFREIRIYDETLRLMQLLGRGHPEHHVRILYVGQPIEDQMLDALGESVIKAWVPLPQSKPAERLWEGDDAPWDAVLAPFTLAAQLDLVFPE